MAKTIHLTGNAMAVLHGIKLDDAVKFLRIIDGLTEEDLQNSKKAFGLYDKQGCGYITSKQIGMLMRTLGQNPTEDELVEILNEYDVDGNGIIDFPEFVCLMQIRLKSVSDEDMLREAFRVFDSDGSGSVSIDEFKSVMAGIPDADQDSALIEEMIAEIDKDGDGQIDYEEFLKLVSAAAPEKEEN